MMTSILLKRFILGTIFVTLEIDTLLFGMLRGTRYGAANRYRDADLALSTPSTTLEISMPPKSASRTIRSGLKAFASLLPVQKP
jgi:hypothetical protein